MSRNKRQMPPGFTHRPFRNLPGIEKDEPRPVPESPVPAPERDRTEELDDESLYERAMADVEPLAGGRKLADKRARSRPMLAEVDDEELVMRHLDDLVHGEVQFDFADTDEYIEACVSGFDRRILRRLRRGEFSYQAYVDLHGLDRKQARERVWRFIDKSFKEGLGCVLIIHGRGLGSKDNIPILKTKLMAWLTRGAIGKKVLAFTSARPYDGGTGALYVLLGKKRR